MANYVIGDIQGCFDELELLLKKIEFSPTDTLWFAGDLVNRGPKSLETLIFIKDLGTRAKIVLGNHDLHLLAIYYTDAQPKRGDTLNQVLQHPQCEDLMQWLRQQPLCHWNKTLNTVMSHAGIPAIWSVEKTLQLADEVSCILRGPNFKSFLDVMYGNIPDMWQDNLKGMDRLRCITNYLTRMRFCDARGQLDLITKGESGTQIAGFHPWFDLHKPSTEAPTIVFGHWAALQGRTNNDNIYALDTGCVWGEELSALRLEDKKLFNVPAI